MRQNILAGAIATVLSDREGLTAAYLPEGISLDEACAIADAANCLRPSAVPFAVVVAPDSVGSAPDQTVVLAPQDLVKYRLDDRLAIVVGRHPELASITTAFNEGLGQSFPDEDLSGGEGTGVLEKLAEAALADVIRASGARLPSDGAFGDGTVILTSAFRHLRSLHSAAGDAGPRRWNARWYRHVNEGLSNLADVVRWHVDNAPVRDHVKLFTQYIFPSFGLPIPANSLDLAGGSGEKVLEALRDWWESEEKVSRSCAYLSADFGSPHPIEGIDWSRLDERVASLDDAVSAWFETVAADVESVLLLGQLSERQFLAPSGNPLKNAAGLIVRTAAGESASTDGVGAAPFVLAAGNNGDGYATEEFRIQIPCRYSATLDENKVASSSLAVTVSPNGGVWDGGIWLSEDGGLVAAGRILLPQRAEDSVISIRLGLGVPSGDVLEGEIPPVVDALVHVLPVDSSGVLALQLDGKNRPGRVSATLVARAAQEGPWIAELSSAVTQYRLIAWAQANARIVVEGRAVERCEGRPWLAISDFSSQAVTVAQIDGNQFELHAAATSRPHLSPLLSAIAQEHPSGDPLDQSTAESVRGRYEAESLSLSANPEWRASLGHLVLSSTDQCEIESVLSNDGVLVPRGITSAWKELVGFSVPKELVDSEEANAFLAAFDALDLFGIDADPDLMLIARWPSRYPRRKLWADDRGLLTQYLHAYAALVEKSKLIGDPSGIFWASYPFSIGVWSLKPGFARCESVMLSPLHPLRLAWMAAAEATFWDAEDARRLAGTVQGFGYPLVGPDPYVPGGMLAVQADTGADQIFAGWTVLLAASTQGPAPLKSPDRIGGYPAPGTAASGLNGSAVDAALRTFQRMNPHVSTLTLDLASVAPAPRAAEVDQAVVGVLESWAKNGGDRMPGGVRVLDSAHRMGGGPRATLTNLVRTNVAMPLSWSRYRPNPASSERCNVRVLQDAGVQFKITASTPHKNGIIGAVPLRRFDASVGRLNPAGATVTSPGLRAEDGWEPLTTALRLVEGGPSVEARLVGSLLVDDRADWTVSGESMLSPAAIAELLKHDGGSRMLWEWRPPIFERAFGRSVIERKPYVSVARVPHSFQEQLRSMLSLARGHEASLDNVADLLRQLGSRGVGLSSLLSMGGTHASGALGFYLAFALVDAASSKEKDRLVLPIDASDAFLRVLAQDGVHAGDRQRADLLVIDVSGEDATFIPIEIKFYGLGTEDRNSILPRPESAAFGEPLAQLASTVKLLSEIEQQGEMLRNSNSEGSFALWSNALGALVESAAKLSSNGILPATWQERLSAIVAGTSRFRVGKPIVMYFNHGAAFDDGGRHRAFRLDEFGEEAPITGFGAFVADSATTFRELEVESSSLVADWRALLEWSSGVDVQTSAPSPTLAPVSPQPAPMSEPVHEPVAVPELQTMSKPAPDLKSVASSMSDVGKGIHFPVGQLVDSVGTASAYFWPSNTELNQMNVGVVGDLGTGKTQLLKSLVFQLRQGAKRTQENPLSFMIFDYKRDYQDEQFLDVVGGTVLHPYRIPLNIFALPEGFTPHAALQRAAMFADVVSKIYGGVGPMQSSNLKKAILEGYIGADHVPPTLPDVLAGYLEIAGKPDSVSAILQDFIMAEIFSSEREQLLSFEDLMDDTVLVIALSDLGVDQRGKNALVAFFLNMYYDYMLRSKKWKFTDGKPQLRRMNSFLLVDEATNIMAYEFPVLMQLMLQGREFGFGIILASQFLSHFRTGNINYGQPLLTWFIHKVPSVTIKELNQLGVINGAVAGVESRIGMLPVHHALYSSLGYNGTIIHGTPFYKLVAPEPDLQDQPALVEGLE